VVYLKSFNIVRIETMNSQLNITMSAIQNPDDLPMRDRSFVVALVALTHVLLLWSYVSMSSQTKSAHRKMSVSVVMPSSPQAAAVEPKPPEKLIAKPKPAEPQPVEKVAAPDIPAETPSPQQSAHAQPENSAPSLADIEPDYKATYLNNPLPAYPMVARRMGWQGKVVLNVEVLESGLPGQIKLHQSSGRDVLDSTAMQAVRGWRFVAARHNGQMVAKWFLVPIPFVLKEAE